MAAQGGTDTWQNILEGLREKKITSDQGFNDTSDNGLGKRAPM